MDNSNKTNEGHRARLKEKFLNGGFDGFLDYEIIELLLTLGTPRRDCKQVAKEAIKEFGGLKGVLNASRDDLIRIKGIGPSNVFGIKLFQAVSERLSKENIPETINMKSTKEVSLYLQNKIGNKEKELFIVLYLDAKYHLIEDRIISIGILNSALAHPREIFKPAFSLGANAIIVSHNHPSGLVYPSKDDKDITRQLFQVGEVMGIELIDHIIVTTDSFFSFRQELLL